MGIRRLAALVLAVAVVATPRAGLAADGRGCPGANELSKPSCRFLFKGTPITIYGESEATNAQVRVWVTVDGYPEIPPLFECSASGQGFASCTTSFPDDTTALNLTPHPLIQPLALRCNRSGAGTLSYSCAAGGEPGPS